MLHFFQLGLLLSYQANLASYSRIFTDKLYIKILQNEIAAIAGVSAARLCVGSATHSQLHAHTLTDGAAGFAWRNSTVRPGEHLHGYPLLLL
jgi:hypothetical protein